MRSFKSVQRSPLGLGAGVAAAALSLALIGGSAEAKPAKKGPWVVKDLGNGNAVLAGWSSKRKEITLKSLQNVWGKQARCRPSSYSALVTWKVPAVNVRVVNGDEVLLRGKDLCKKPSKAWIRRIRTVGDKWRTNKGVAVGDEIRYAWDDGRPELDRKVLTALHPRAKECIDSPNRWALIPNYAFRFESCRANDDPYDVSHNHMGAGIFLRYRENVSEVRMWVTGFEMVGVIAPPSYVYGNR